MGGLTGSRRELSSGKTIDEPTEDYYYYGRVSADCEGKVNFRRPFEEAEGKLA